MSAGRTQLQLGVGPVAVVDGIVLRVSAPDLNRLRIALYRFPEVERPLPLQALVPLLLFSRQREVPRTFSRGEMPNRFWRT